jgi:hypothetical protein
LDRITQLRSGKLRFEFLAESDFRTLLSFGPFCLQQSRLVLGLEGHSP